jgi:DNA (cytosine-5)-methyltransferase 1
MNETRDDSFTFIDLFCGCGGFTLGLTRAGFRCLAAVDFNEEAVATLRANFPVSDLPHVLQRDLTAFHPRELARLIGTDHLDVIVGGPPCQGYSQVRQVDAANHGPRVKRDKRRYLFRAFLDYVQFFKPRVFVMENVLGLQSAAKGKFFTLVQHEARLLGYRVHPQVEESWKLGVPQKRRRQLIVGVRVDVHGFFPSELQPAPRGFAPGKERKCPTLWDAIGDLPLLEAGTGIETREYDLNRRGEFLERRGKEARHYLESVLQVSKAPKLTAHRARPHSARDLRDFDRLKEGEHSGEAIRRGERMEFPYKRTCFDDRFKRQHREELCSTIVAHLSKDGLMFIHPTQNRSLTPREAARVQSFPDWFGFPVARTHQFRIIGNAVPPLVAEAVGHEILRFLNRQAEPETEPDKPEDSPRVSLPASADLPADHLEARRRLNILMQATRRELCALDKKTFLAGWHSLLWLFPDLHPNNALDHGAKRVRATPTNPSDADLGERYARSGWPVALVLIGEEAWRRFERKEFDRDAFYCVAAQRAGMTTLRATANP